MYIVKAHTVRQSNGDTMNFRAGRRISMDALGNYLGALWNDSMQRMTVTQCLEYSPLTRRWEMRGGVRGLYLAARNGEVLAVPDSEIA